MNRKNKTPIFMKNISKNFGDVCALNNVNFKLNMGEIRGLVGENGAGKTTLMNILYGLYRQDEGSISIWGEDISEDWSPRLAIFKGLGMIHQYFALVSNHTVLENIVMPIIQWKDVSPDWSSHNKHIKLLCKKYNFKIDLETKIKNLSMGERQQVEILKVLYQGAKILILDEPTSVLTPQQSKSLLNLLIKLREDDYSIIVITHKLNEIFEVSDNITVLRNGKHIGTRKRKSTDPKEISNMMVNQEIPPIKNVQAYDKNRIMLKTKNLSIKNKELKKIVDKVSMEISAGEIVGIAGVSGNGQIELAESIMGLRDLYLGDIMIEGKKANDWSVSKRRENGLGYIPEERKSGVIKSISVADNLVINTIDNRPFSKLGIINNDFINKWTKKIIEDYNIKTLSNNVPIEHLSGGNIQKVILARTLSLDPKVIVASQPTQGLDLSAIEYVRNKLLDAARNGISILLISTDLDEILQLSHRIFVMYEGEIVGEFERGEVDIGKIGLLMAGKK